MTNLDPAQPPPAESVNPSPTPVGAFGRPRPRRMLAALAVTALVSMALFLREWPAPAYPLLMASWVAALGLALAAWPRPAAWSLSAADKRSLVTDVGLVLAVSLAWRLPGLAVMPPNYSGDEFQQALEASRFLTGEHANMFGASLWYGVPQMYMWLGSLVMRVVGVTPFAWRLASALPAALTPAIVYLLLRVQLDPVGRASGEADVATPRRRWSARIALIAGLLLAFHHLSLFFTRLGSNQGLDGLFMSLALLAGCLGLRTRQGVWFFLAGMLAGAGFYFYFALRGIALMVLGLLSLAALRLNGAGWRAPVWMAIGLAVVALPHLADAARGAPETDSLLGLHLIFGARTTQVAELPLSDADSSNTLAQRAVFTWQSVQGRGLKGWYESGAGILISRIEFAFLLLGTAVALGRSGRLWIYPLLLAGILTSVGLLTENPVASQRISSTAVPASILVALGVDAFAKVLAPRRREAAAVVAVGIVAAVNVAHLFLGFLPMRNFDTTALISTELGHFLAVRPEIQTVYFCGGPRMDWGSNASLQFRFPDLNAINVGEPHAEPLPGSLAPGSILVTIEECAGGRTESVRRGLDGWTLLFRPPTSMREAASALVETGGRGRLRWIPAGERRPPEATKEVITVFGTAPPEGAPTGDEASTEEG